MMSLFQSFLEPSPDVPQGQGMPCPCNRRLQEMDIYIDTIRKIQSGTLYLFKVIIKKFLWVIPLPGGAPCDRPDPQGDRKGCSCTSRRNDCCHRRPTPSSSMVKMDIFEEKMQFRKNVLYLRDYLMELYIR
jgi:hypothetical protein